jgi:hypothetical protein
MIFFIFVLPLYIMYLLGKRSKGSSGIIQSLYYGILIDEYNPQHYFWEFLKIYLRSKKKKYIF